LNDFDGGINFQPVSYYAEKGQEYMIGFFNPYVLKNLVPPMKALRAQSAGTR
jgi:hypothetical protein